MASVPASHPPNNSPCLNRSYAELCVGAVEFEAPIPAATIEAGADSAAADSDPVDTEYVWELLAPDEPHLDELDFPHFQFRLEFKIQLHSSSN